MVQLTQNNKIAVIAVSIFVVSFAAMLFFMNKDEASPDFIQSNVLESTINNSGEHGVYFSEGGSGKVGTEANLKENPESEKLEEAYRSLSNQKEAPLFVLSPEGNVKFLSKNFIEKYGYKLAELSGKSFFSYVYPSDLPEFASAYTGVLQSGKSSNGVGPYRFENKDESFSIHVASLLPVVDEKSKVSEVVIYVKDITSQIQDFAEQTKKALDGTSVDDKQNEENKS